MKIVTKAPPTDSASKAAPPTGNAWFKGAKKE
jgi:hypothetical protein